MGDPQDGQINDADKAVSFYYLPRRTSHLHRQALSFYPLQLDHRFKADRTKMLLLSEATANLTVSPPPFALVPSSARFLSGSVSWVRCLAFTWRNNELDHAW